MELIVKRLNLDRDSNVVTLDSYIEKKEEVNDIVNEVKEDD